ncbi:MAG: 50S ribosomal protein L4, partial [Candidatus Caldarchaeum sp.]
MNFTASLLLQKPQQPTVKVYNLEGEAVETIPLPSFFSAPLREDLVARAYIHLATHSLQPKGASKISGHKHSVESWGPGFGMARISRIKGRG